MSIKAIRLREDHIKAIKSLAKKYFGENAKVYLFGSRVDINKKGGDTDLLIVHFLEEEEACNMRTKFVIDLYKVMGEQKIDLLLYNPNQREPKLIEKIALEEGIKL